MIGKALLATAASVLLCAPALADTALRLVQTNTSHEMIAK